MNLQTEKRKEFEDAARPLIKWLNDNCHPHVMAIVEPDRVVLVEGVCSSPITDYIKD